MGRVEFRAATYLAAGTAAARWEAIGLAARDYAHGVAAQLAEVLREKAPTTTDVTEAILALARTQGLPGPGGWPSTIDGDDG